MLPATEERTPALTSGEETFSLAAGVDPKLETHQGPREAQGKKPHQGIFSKKRALRVSPMWAKWSGTHQDRKCSWSKTVLGSALDANGNTLSDPSGKSYSWDFENRLTQALVPGTGTVAFKYDPFGRRIQKSGPLGTTNYLYDGKDIRSNVIEEVDNSGNVLARYTQNRGIDQPLAEVRSSATSYYEADGLGSVTSLSGSTGAVANTYTYDSFGKVTNFAGTLSNPFQYTGHGSDPETNLDYYRFRYYDPSTGRFLSEDPIAFSGGIDFYSYVRNHPLDYVDLFGLSCCKKSPPPPPPNQNPIPNGISKDYEAYWKCVNNVTVECEMPEPPSGNPFEPPGGPGGDMGVTPNEGTIPLPQWKIPDACECLRQHPLAPLDPRYGDVPEPGNCF